MKFPSPTCCCGFGPLPVGAADAFLHFCEVIVDFTDLQVVRADAGQRQSMINDINECIRTLNPIALSPRQ